MIIIVTVKLNSIQAVKKKQTNKFSAKKKIDFLFYFLKEIFFADIFFLIYLLQKIFVGKLFFVGI